MANPQLENGHLRIANDIWDALVQTRVPGEAMQVLMAIIRKTYGWGKKEDAISLSQLQEMTGISDKSHLVRARQKLLDMNIIVAEKGNAVAQYGNAVTKYRINKDFESWRPLPKKATLPKKAKAVAQKGNKPLPKKAPTKDNKKDTITKDKGESIWEQWNAFAGPLGLAVVLKLTDKRSAAIGARLSEQTFDLPGIFEKIKASSFLRGENDRGWKVDFDFVFCSANNYLKILEGKYDDKRACSWSGVPGTY